MRHVFRVGTGFMTVISLSKQATLLIDITKANRHAVEVPLVLEVYEG